MPVAAIVSTLSRHDRRPGRSRPAAKKSPKSHAAHAFWSHGSLPRGEVIVDTGCSGGRTRSGRADVISLTGSRGEPGLPAGRHVAGREARSPTDASNEVPHRGLDGRGRQAITAGSATGTTPTDSSIDFPWGRPSWTESAGTSYRSGAPLPRIARPGRGSRVPRAIPADGPRRGTSRSLGSSRVDAAGRSPE